MTTFDEELIIPRGKVCILARIVKIGSTNSTTSPESKTTTGVTTDEVFHLGTNVKNNNDIFTKNLIIEDQSGNGTVERVATVGEFPIGNPYPFAISTKIRINQD